MREFIAKEDQITAPIAERLIRCKDCLSWKTPLAFTSTGKCAHPDHKGQITNRNYFCADGIGHENRTD